MLREGAPARCRRSALACSAQTRAPGAARSCRHLLRRDGATQRTKAKRATQRHVHCSAERGAPRSGAEPSIGNRIGSFVDAQFLPIGLVVAIVGGYCLPGVASAVADADAATVATTVIFLLSGLQMRKGLATEALQYRGMFALGLVCILAMTPLIARLVLAAPIAPPEFAIGLAVFFCMPTSLSANIALAGTVGANTAMSLLLTATSNVLAVFTVPFVTARLLAMAGAVSFDPVAMMVRLVKAVLVPLAVGVLLRGLPQVRGTVDGSKGAVRKLSTLCLATVPFSQMGSAKLTGSLATLTPQMLATMASSVLAALVTLRLINLVLFSKIAAATSVPSSISRAVILAANQKTLPLSIAVLWQLKDAIGPSVGLATLPCMLAHFSQVLLDSLIIDRWQAADAEQDSAAAAT